jgi:hypothetical protein
MTEIENENENETATATGTNATVLIVTVTVTVNATATVPGLPLSPTTTAATRRTMGVPTVTRGKMVAHLLMIIEC